MKVISMKEMSDQILKGGLNGSYISQAGFMSGILPLEC